MVVSMTTAGPQRTTPRALAVSVEEWDLRWNAVQRFWQHKSSGDDSDASDDVILLQ